MKKQKYKIGQIVNGCRIYCVISKDDYRRNINLTWQQFCWMCKCNPNFHKSDYVYYTKLPKKVMPMSFEEFCNNESAFFTKLVPGLLEQCYASVNKTADLAIPETEVYERTYKLKHGKDGWA